MGVTLVDFKTKRHEKKAKKLLSECCDMIESLAPLSGYAIVAWDATGRAGVRIEQGGGLSTRERFRTWQKTGFSARYARTCCLKKLPMKLARDFEEHPFMSPVRHPNSSKPMLSEHKPPIH